MILKTLSIASSFIHKSYFKIIMIFDTVRQFNWVDIVFILIFLRFCYIGLKNGFFTALFKSMGTILAIYVSLHYYTIISDFLAARVNLKVLPKEFLDFIVFVLLSSLSYLFFVGIRELLSRYLKMEAVPQLNKWGGFVVSIIRAFFLTSLVSFGLLISTVAYLKTSAVNSYSGRPLYTAASSTYRWFWHGFMSKFMTHEKFNETVLEVQEPEKK
ncbi:MAG: CvpA family protein [Candidatus Omnitrophota bacterium]